MNPTPVHAGAIGKHRLESLSDGVFSVVMTLLVLDLRQDFLRAVTENDHAVGPMLMALKHPLMIYAITFVLSGMFWIHQNRMFQLLTHSTVRHAWLTLLFLFWVTLLPLTFTVTGKLTGLLFYLGNMSLIALSLLLGWIDARRSGLIAVENFGAHRVMTVRIATLAGGCAAAMIATFFIPDYGWMALFLIALPGRIVAAKLASAAA